MTDEPEPVEATLTIDELEDLLDVEDQRGLPRGSLLLGVDLTAWALAAFGLRAATPEELLARIREALRKDDCDDESLACFDSWAKVAVEEPRQQQLLKAIQGRPIEDPNPFENSPAVVTEGDVEVQVAPPSWVHRWFALAGDAVGVSAADLPIAVLHLLMISSGEYKGYSRWESTMQRIHDLHAQAAKTPDPTRRLALLDQAEELLTEVQIDLGIESARGQIQRQAIGVMHYAHAREAFDEWVHSTSKPEEGQGPTA